MIFGTGRVNRNGSDNYVGITHSGFLRKQRPDAIVPYDQRRRGSKKYGGTESCNVSTDTVNFRQRRRL